MKTILKAIAFILVVFLIVVSFRWMIWEIESLADYARNNQALRNSEVDYLRNSYEYNIRSGVREIGVHLIDIILLSIVGILTIPRVRLTEVISKMKATQQKHRNKKIAKLKSKIEKMESDE